MSNDVHKAFYNKTYLDKEKFYEKMQRTINENISMENAIIQASNTEPTIDPI